MRACSASKAGNLGREVVDLEMGVAIAAVTAAAKRGGRCNTGTRAADGRGGPVEGDPSGVVVAWRGTAAGPRCTRLARAQASNDEHQRRVAPFLLSQLHARPGAHSTTSCDPLPGSLATRSEFERVAIIVVENLQ